MIRVSEMVLPGHPDKFCDQVADAVIAESVRADSDAYGQVEVAAWSDRVWLNGGICTRRPLEKSLREIVVETGRAIGYVPGNHVDAEKYVVESSVCLLVGEPHKWTRHVNDQSIVIGWAGHDSLTRYLPPEHFLAHVLAEALFESCRWMASAVRTARPWSSWLRLPICRRAQLTAFFTSLRSSPASRSINLRNSMKVPSGSRLSWTARTAIRTNPDRLT